MKLKIRYDTAFDSVEVDTDEAWEWLNLKMEDESAITEEDRAQMVQEEFNRLFNRPEYNNWHKFQRKLDGAARPKKLNGQRGKAVAKDDTKAPVEKMESFVDRNDSITVFERDAEVEALCEKIRRSMKPAQAELIIAIYIDRMKKQDYAAQIGISPSALSHRLETAEKNFKKIWGNPQF